MVGSHILLDSRPYSRIYSIAELEAASVSGGLRVHHRLNFREYPRLINHMRLSAFRLFALLIAWCVGFQSTATAMGMPCAHGRMTMTEPNAAMPAGMHHAGMTMPMDHTDPAVHQHHHMGADAKTTTDAKVSAAKVGCQCGCSCATIGCVSGGPGIASLTSSSFFAAAPAAFPLQEAHSGLRSAHGLDLIRPPSKS